MHLTELPLCAQTAYAELFSQAQAFELNNPLAGLVGTFHKRVLKGRSYWYFGYRDEATRQDEPLALPARMAIAAGCAPVAAKHFRVIRRLAEYGLFRAGGLLIGTHARCPGTRQGQAGQGGARPGGFATRRAGTRSSDAMAGLRIPGCRGSGLRGHKKATPRWLSCKRQGGLT